MSSFYYKSLKIIWICIYIEHMMTFSLIYYILYLVKSSVNGGVIRRCMGPPPSLQVGGYMASGTPLPLVIDIYSESSAITIIQI